MTNIKNFYLKYPLFDWMYYIEKQSNYLINDEIQAITHFLNININNKILYNKNCYYNNFELDNIDINAIGKGFDWKYYLNNHDDLKIFKTKHEAYNHYILYGIDENRIKNVLEKYDIKQLIISPSINHFKNRFLEFYNLSEYSNENENTLYFGVYGCEDIENIKKIKNKKYIIFSGLDVDILLSNAELKKKFDEIEDKCIFHISDNINHRLCYYGYPNSIKFNLDITDKNIFKKPNFLGNSIFIDNGYHKGLEHLYGKHIYDEIIRRNQQFNYIFSNELNLKYEDMYHIYKKCFIGLRLSISDGNANMVKEMECMEIPVVHNHSEYGLKWNNLEDVENAIYNNEKKNDNTNEIKTTLKKFDINNDINCNLTSKTILIVLDKYLKGGIECHTDILQRELTADIMVFEKTSTYKTIDSSYLNYDVVIWQNIFNLISEKKEKQKYIYIVHSQCDWYSEENKKNIRKNDVYIDIYIFVSNNVKKIFEENILKPNNYYVIENQIPNIKNTKEEIKGLFVCSGSYNDLKGHYELIVEFSKLDKIYKLEIYGNSYGNEYYNKLLKYIDDNELYNIKLFDFGDNYIERLKEAEYFCLFSKSEGCSYSMLEAIKLNKKIICTSECLTEQMKWYPNKYIFMNNDYNINWFQIKKVDYLPYSFFHFIEPYKNIIIGNKNNKIDLVEVKHINEVLDDLDKKHVTIDKEGYSILLRIKNEQETIEKCILDIVDLVDEIIIVDNNSTDNTLKIITKLEKIYLNIKVYSYNINIPRYGSEHIENYTKNDFMKNNTLKNYYNWTASKATYNKKIKWDGDFYCIRHYFKQLLDDFKNNTDYFAVHFSGITVFVDDAQNYYIKNNSHYNEYRLFLNKEKKIWSDNIFENKNYCETSERFVENVNNKNISTIPYFFEIKMSYVDEFSSRSTIINDGRDNIDYQILNNLRNKINDSRLNITNNIFNSINNYYYEPLWITNDKSILKKIKNIKYLNINTNIDLFNTNLRMFSFAKKKNILCVIDSFGWAFDNITNNIIKHNYSNEYAIEKTTYPELVNKIQKNYEIDEWRSKNNYFYCSIDTNFLYDLVIFFWYGSNINVILDYYKNKKNKIFLAIYDYSQWVNNVNKVEEKMYRDKLDYFIKKIDGYLYGSPFIKKTIDEIYLNNNLLSCSCYDGVDSKLFCNYSYEKNIYTKEKLIIGWIGNSDPYAHGINKGFEIIKKIINNMSDKFIFKPQDIYTGKKISHVEIPQYINEIDIIICFSIAEGTPNQILESSSCSKCWISTNVGIVDELNNTGDKTENAGIIIKRNEEELEQALLKLYENREYLVQSGINGRKKIKQEWDWSNKVKQFYDLFETI